VEPSVSLVELAGLIIVVGTAAFTVIKVARLWISRPQSPSADVTSRLEALEGSVQQLQQEQTETQERLDFAERLLSKAREERRISS
jgi:predicted  nucleic acid-binding Zn-ribbon protein